jgi:hypothetical protein
MAAQAVHRTTAEELTRPDVMRGPRFTSTGPGRNPRPLTSSDFRCGLGGRRGVAKVAEYRAIFGGAGADLRLLGRSR